MTRSKTGMWVQKSVIVTAAAALLAVGANWSTSVVHEAFTSIFPSRPAVASSNASKQPLLVVPNKEGADEPTAALTKRQVDHAQVIVEQASKAGVGELGARVGLITALQESSLLNYANDGSSPDISKAEADAVAKSLDHPHDAVGTDRDSVGLFQQRPSHGWGTVAELMDPETAAARFYEQLAATPGWQDMLPGEAAQVVQRSAFGDEYDKWVETAEALLREINGY